MPAVPPQWPPCKGPSPAPRPQRAGRGGARPLALRPRPGEPRPPLLARPGPHIRDHEEHGVINLMTLVVPE